MRRTNSKEVKKYFDEYLQDIIADNFEGSLEALAFQYYESARDAKGRLYQNFKDCQEGFETITFNYGSCWYQEMKEMLMEALQQTEAEADKYTDNQVAHLFNYLLYCAYIRRCEKENVKAIRFAFRY